MKINLIAVGNLSKEYKSLFNDYSNKLGFYAELRVSEVRPVVDKNIETINKKKPCLLNR